MAHWVGWCLIASALLSSGCRLFSGRRVCEEPCVVDPCASFETLPTVSAMPIQALPAFQAAAPTIPCPEPGPLALPPVATPPPPPINQWHPEPPPRQPRAEVTPSAPPIVQRTEPPELKSVPPTPAPTQTVAKPRPGGLDVAVASQQGMASVGEEVTFEVTVRNQGESAIDSVKLSATASDNLSILDVTPNGVAQWTDRGVTFDPITPLNPTPSGIVYRIKAKVLSRDGGSGKLAIEASTPIDVDPIKDEAAISIPGNP